MNVWCADATLYDKDCALEGKKCGWVAEYQYYGCEDTGEAEPTGIFPSVCPFVCAPECAGKECGNDGCDGVCGVCASDESCEEFKCISNSTETGESGESGSEDEGANNEEEGDEDDRSSSDGCRSQGPFYPTIPVALFLLFMAGLRSGTRRTH